MTPREQQLAAGLGAALEHGEVGRRCIDGAPTNAHGYVLGPYRDAMTTEQEASQRELHRASLLAEVAKARSLRTALDGLPAPERLDPVAMLERARAALPALRAAAEGRSRDAVRAAVEHVAEALGEGGSHGATGPNRGSVSPETMSPGR